MKPELRQLQRYLHDVLDVQVSITEWDRAKQLPPFLRERYAFSGMKLLGTNCLLLLDDNRTEQSPAVIRKHLDLLRDKHAGEVIYVRPQVSAYNRKRLIEQKVPFIVPGNQLYLPMLAMDLREHFRKVKSESAPFKPATQALLLYLLLYEQHADVIPLEMAKQLGYTPMTMTRAFDELEDAKLGSITAQGRERRLRRADARADIWATAQPFLRSPVTQRLFVPKNTPVAGIRAGLTALSHYSMLAPPVYVSRALSREQWKELNGPGKLTVLPYAEPGAVEIQVWRYSPNLLAKKEFADPLSIYLSLKHDEDERTQGAMQEMIKTLGW